MNSAFVAERARNVAAALLDDKQASETQRIERAYLITLNRKPEPADVDAAITYLSSFRQRLGESRTPLDAWQSYARILISSNDFMYLD
jgi:hypothetical protein